jgi:hypothetical protein
LAASIPKAIDAGHRIKVSELAKLVNALLRVTSDANLSVLSSLLHALNQLAASYKKAFAPSARKLFALLLDRLKEKKPVAQPVHETLKALYGCFLNIGDVLEPVSVALLSKMPRIKMETLTWFLACVGMTPVANLAEFQRQVCEMLLRSSDDSNQDIRKAAFAAIAKVVDVLEEQFVLSAMLIERTERQKLQAICSCITYKGPAVAALLQSGKPSPVRPTTRGQSLSSSPLPSPRKSLASAQTPHSARTSSSTPPSGEQGRDAPAITASTKRSKSAVLERKVAGSTPSPSPLAAAAPVSMIPTPPPKVLHNESDPVTPRSREAKLSPLRLDPVTPLQGVVQHPPPQPSSSSPPKADPSPNSKSQRTPREASALAQARASDMLSPRDVASPPEITTAEDVCDKEMHDALLAIRGALSVYEEKMLGAVAQLEGLVGSAADTRKQRRAATTQLRKDLRQKVVALHGELKATQRELDAERKARQDLEARVASAEQERDEAKARAAELGRVVSQELAAIKLQSRCVKCGSNPKQVVLLPCRHRPLCALCAERATSCPVCSRPTESKISVFDS